MHIQIKNPDDARLDAYRNIRERDLVKNQRQFIAEGKTVLQVLANQSRFDIQSLLILENRLAGVENLIAKLSNNIPIYVVPQAVIDVVAGFPMHRGVLAIGTRPSIINQPPLKTEEWKRIVVLSGLSNHDNVGSIFRNAAAFNADAVLLDAACCDPLYRKAIRVSVGAVLQTPWHIFPTIDELLIWLTDEGFETAALSPSGTTNLSQWKPASKSAIMLGTEGDGLPSQLLSQHTSLRVEMSEEFDSLNVATTSGIVLHHMMLSQR